MKPLVVIVLFFTLCYASQWEQIGPYGGLVYRIGLAPSNDNVMYGIANLYPNRVYKSTDGGASWNKTADTFYVVPPVFAVAVDPTNPDIVYMGGIECGDNWDIGDTVFKSTDGGLNWIANYVPGGVLLHAVVVQPATPSIVFAAGSAGGMAFCKSTDAGINWTTTTFSTTGEVYDISIDPSNPDIVYVGGYDTMAAVYKSTDCGVSFTNVSSGLSLSDNSVYSIAVHPTNSNYVYLGTYYGRIYRSMDGGGSWSAVNTVNHPIYELATTPADPSIVYASTDYRIYKSADAGTSWGVSDSGPWGGWGLAAKISDANIVFSSNYTGFYKSTNGGLNWFRSDHGIDWYSINGIGIAPSSPTTIYTGDYFNFKTTNCGNDWFVLPPSYYYLAAYAVHNTDPVVVFSFSQDC